MAHLLQDLWYKVTHLSGDEELEVQGKYLGVGPDQHHLFEIEGVEEPVRIHPDHMLDYFEVSRPMPFPR